MRKLLSTIVIIVLGVLGLTSCNNSSSNSEEGFDTSKNITIYTRDTTSGTRDGFFTGIGLEDAVKSNSVLKDGAVEVSGNGAMLTAVSNDEYGIGYASLASVIENSDIVKGLSYNGVTPSIANIQNDTYKLSRNFNYIVKQDADMSSEEATLVKAFLAYMNSQEGLAVIEANDGILLTSISSAPSWNSLKESNEDVKAALALTSDVTIHLGGSTSVEKIAKALSQSFHELVPHFVANHNHTGSGDAYKNTQGEGKDGTGSLEIGFLSREIKLTSTEAAASGTYGFICKDGIVAIVNPENDSISNVTPELLNQIFTGSKATWADLQ